MNQEKPLSPFFESSIKSNVLLAPFTTLKIGGPAQYFIEVNHTENLIEAVHWAHVKNLPIFVLGGGSNLVIADSGFQGLVIHNTIRGMRFLPDLSEFGCSRSPETYVTVGAGENWSTFVERVVARNLAGVECLSGIPGQVGSTPIQNVGAYGQDVSETITTVEAYDLQTHTLVELSAAECEFGYRASRFKHRDRNRFIITSVTYKLLLDGEPQIRYAELKRFLDERGMRHPRLVEVSQSVIEIRKRKAMVLSDDPNSRSVGSFFVNPTVRQSEFEQIQQRAEKILAPGEQMPAYPATQQQVKLSAAWLIERAGIRRGTVYGRVGTSTKHSLAIINRGGGTASEIIEFAEHIKSRVFDTFGVELTPEPVFVGFE